MWVEIFSRVGVACRVEIIIEKRGACSENWVEILRKRVPVVRIGLKY